MGIAQIGLKAILDLLDFNRNVKQYNAGVDTMTQQTEKAAGKITEASKSINVLGIATTAVIGLLTEKTASMVYEFGKLGAATLRTEDAFYQLAESAGGSGKEIITAIKRATSETVSSASIMASVSRGILLGLGAQADQWERLAEVARLRARAMGMSMTQALDDIITGIGRESRMILDNLGIIIDTEQVMGDYAKAIGKTSDELTAAERKQAILNSVIKEGEAQIVEAGGIVDNYADSFAQLETKIEEARTKLAKQWAPIEIKILLKVEEAGETFNEIGTIVKANLAKWAAELQGLDEAQREAVYEYNILRGAGLSEAEAAQQAAINYQGRIEALRNASMAAAQAAAGLRTYVPLIVKEIEATLAATAAQVDHDAQMEAGAVSVEDYAKALEKVRAEQMAITGVMATSIIKLRDLDTKQTESTRKYSSELAKLRADASDAYDDIGRKYENSLPDATSVEQRLNMAADAWDEWGLRLQDIINQGIASPWYNTLLEMGYQKPPNVGVKEWAAELKADFYEGELPGLINTGATAWQRHADEVAAAQAEETAAVNTEIANRRAALEAERQAELAAQKQARQNMVVQMALQIAEESGLLQQWAGQRMDALSGMADTADEVWALLQSGMLELDTGLSGIISDYTGDLLSTLDTTASQAEETNTKLAGIIAGAADDANRDTSKSMDSLVDSVTTKGDDAVKESTEVARKTVSAFDGMGRNMEKVGKAMVDGLQVGIEEDWGGFSSWLGGLIVALIKSLILGIAGGTTAGGGGGGAGGGTDMYGGGGGASMTRYIHPALPATISSPIANYSYGGDTIVLNINNRDAWAGAQSWIESRRRDRINVGM